MKKKMICVLLVISVAFLAAPVTSSAQDETTDYDLGYISGHFLIETEYDLEDEELNSVFALLPEYEICLFLKNEGNSIYFMRLADKKDHETAYEILQSAGDVLKVSLDQLYECDPDNCSYDYFGILIETEYKWFDKELDEVRWEIPKIANVMKVESDLVNFYFLQTEDLTNRSFKELIEGLKAFKDIITVKRNDMFYIAALGVPSPDKGDLDGDNDITVTDFMILKHIILDLADFERWQITNADVNCDGNVDSTDVLLMKKCLLGLIRINPSRELVDLSEDYPAQLIICCLFGHNFDKGELVSVIEHNVREIQPKCLEEIRKVYTCSRCHNIRSELISSRYIYCDE